MLNDSKQNTTIVNQCVQLAHGKYFRTYILCKRTNALAIVAVELSQIRNELDSIFQKSDIFFFNFISVQSSLCLTNE